MQRYIFVNQVTGPLFIDILNVFAENDENVVLFTGEIEKASVELDKRISVKYSFKYKRNKPVSRIFTWLLFYFSVLVRLIVSKKDFELFLVSNPPIAPFLGIIFKKLFGLNYHILIYDIYPDALVKFNYITKNSFIYKTWTKLNNIVFNNAVNIFTISEFMAKTITKYYSNTENLKIIDNWVDTDFIKPIKKDLNWFAKKHDIVDKLTVLYSGNLGQMHDLESVIEAAKILKDNNRIVFVIIGDGAKKVKLEGLVQLYDLKNVILLPFQAPDVIPFSMTSADIGVITLAEGAEDLSVPSKTYYMMAAGNALLVISDRDSEVAKLCNRFNMGKVVSPNSPDKIVEFLTDCLNQNNLLSNLSNNARVASKSFTALNASFYYKYVKTLN